MTKTQIQVPEELFAEIKQFAQRREWSLAETFRRGAELLLETYVEDTPPVSEPWQPPTSGRVGWKGLTADQLHDLAVDDQTRIP
jgi:hypothetical protein